MRANSADLLNECIWLFADSGCVWTCLRTRRFWQAAKHVGIENGTTRITGTSPTYFHQTRRGRKDLERKDPHPPMDILKHWMMEKEESVMETAGTAVGIDETKNYGILKRMTPRPEGRIGQIITIQVDKFFVYHVTRLGTHTDTAPAPDTSQRGEGLPVNVLP
ncbi:uncharacterized protein DSM5745_05521 [Aspergillus mulundensis]|uniref:Uncharacterized protein n=1 Tax=Aspergillus mulundensis TaxID=1810919 RepID=A0A3D8RX80_9EURO|nr:hypothetical protein DSM5745_05521 [Aspergillus mulundensis]RDW78669.1 hypothetical protein DSM5745_05521 [Aspergillus mulundensis]